MSKITKNKNIKLELEDNIKLEDNSKIVNSSKEMKKYGELVHNALSNQERNIMFISGKNELDLFTMLEREDFLSLFNAWTFEYKLDLNSDDNFLNKIRTKRAPNTFLSFLEEEGVTYSESFAKKLNKKFSETKKLYIKNLENASKDRIKRLLRFKNSSLSLSKKMGGWMMHIGFLFLEIRTNDSIIRTPLFVKSVDLDIKNEEEVIIKSIDSNIKFNKNLLLLLKTKYGIHIDVDKILAKNGDKTIKELIEKVIIEIESSIEEDVQFDVNVFNRFEIKEKYDVKNSSIKLTPGVVLFVGAIDGAQLAENLINIISSGKISDMLSFDPFTNITNISERAIKGGQQILKINETDFFQEMAIVGSLIDSSIILGPPGTGKTQTLSSLVSNILFDDFSFLISSEKKVALQVLKKRMGTLSKYIFFDVENNGNIDEFYKDPKLLIKALDSDFNEIYNDFFSYWTDRSNQFLEHSEKIKQNEDVLALLYISNFVNTKKRFNKLIKFEIVINKYRKFIEQEFENKEKLENILSEKGFIYNKYFKGDKNVKKLFNFIKYSQEVSGDEYIKFIKQSILIKDLHSLKNINKLIDSEANFIIERENKDKFISSIGFLENMLLFRTKAKISEMKKDPFMTKKIDLFIRDIISGKIPPVQFIQLHIDVIRNLYSGISSTTSRLAEMIEWNKVYDYVIFDESSQITLENSIPFINIAKKTIISGDPQQMKPSTMFAIKSENSISEDLPESADSLLDYAYRKGMKGSREFILKKNYRSSSAQLTLFSSKEFYDSNLEVIDDNNLDSSLIPMEVYEIDGVWDHKRRNEKEAIALLEHVNKIYHKYNSIIILALNTSQRDYIMNRMSKLAKYKNLFKQTQDDIIRVLNLENVQGDEADLVVMSVAYDKNSKLYASYIARNEGRNALNVAITRARDKMIIFKSIKSYDVEESFKNESISTFSRWLSYLEMTNEQKDPQTIYKNFLNNSQRHNDNIIRKNIHSKITELFADNVDITIDINYPIGTYEIDIAIFYKKSLILSVILYSVQEIKNFQNIISIMEKSDFLSLKKYNIYEIGLVSWIKKSKYITDEIKSIVRKKIDKITLEINSEKAKINEQFNENINEEIAS